MVTLDAAPNLAHLEPIEPPQGLTRPQQPGPDRRIDTLARRADNFVDDIGLLSGGALEQLPIAKGSPTAAS